MIQLKVPLDKIIIDPTRDRSKSNQYFQLLKDGIEIHGLRVPLTLENDFKLVDGHSRYKACKELGIKEVWCQVMDDTLTDEQYFQLRLCESEKYVEVTDLEYKKQAAKLFGLTTTDVKLLLDNVDKIPDVTTRLIVTDRLRKIQQNENKITHYGKVE